MHVYCFFANVADFAENGQSFRSYVDGCRSVATLFLCRVIKCPLCPPVQAVGVFQRRSLARTVPAGTLRRHDLWSFGFRLRKASPETTEFRSVGSGHSRCPGSRYGATGWRAGRGRSMGQ
jgi:hypothetical protein